MHLRTDTGANAHFAKVPTISRGRNAFTVAKSNKTTIQFDYLFPVYWDYIYPGDTASLTLKALARLTTQVAPLFDDLYIDFHAWYVPFRLLQTNWARYQYNAQPAGPSQVNTSLTAPSIDLATLGAGGFASKSLYDYFGFPTKINTAASSQKINNYLGRAYNLIWNENYRDQNLQNPVVVDLDDGQDLASDYVLLKRGRRHDKFASALPAPQKGTAPLLPLAGYAPVLGIGKANNSFDAGPANYRESSGLVASYANYKVVTVGANNEVALEQNPTNAGWPYIRADLAQAFGPSVNAMRQSVAVQHLFEADARGGTRDVEAIQNRWGVTVPDFRIQRPEWLGGATYSFDGHIVPQTSATTGSSYQAGLAQFSQSMSAFSVTHSFHEAGVFMILMSARSNVTYQQGLDKRLSYSTRFDWYQPEFSNLGEVAMLMREIYFTGTDVADTAAWGYNEYGYELRYSDNTVTGEMRSNFTTPRDYQHMADKYTSAPALGAAWIQSSTPISRNITVSASTADPIQINSIVQGTMARTLPMYSIPGLLRL